MSTAARYTLADEIRLWMISLLLDLALSLTPKKCVRAALALGRAAAVMTEDMGRGLP